MKKSNGLSKSGLDRVLARFGLRRKRRNNLQIFTIIELEPRNRSNKLLYNLIEGME